MYKVCTGAVAAVVAGLLSLPTAGEGLGAAVALVVKEKHKKHTPNSPVTAYITRRRLLQVDMRRGPLRLIIMLVSPLILD
jgi:hypothetical protein